MAITERTVKNKRNSAGELTGKAGSVYDVNVKYKSGGKSKTYSRKGFLTKKDALIDIRIVKAKLTNPAYTPPSAVQRKMTVREYMTEWIDRHGSANLRPSTEASYRSNLKNHIYPYIGDVFLSQLSPSMLDDLYRRLSENGLSPSSVRYVHRIMGVSLEHARRYHYISSNPARDILTKFGKPGKTPESLYRGPDAAAVGRCHGNGVGADRGARRSIWASPQRDHWTAMEECRPG